MSTEINRNEPWGPRSGESFNDWCTRCNLDPAVAAEFLPGEPPPGYEIVEGDILRPIQNPVIDQKTEETFEEMCKRLGLDPRCVCTFAPKECGT